MASYEWVLKRPGYDFDSDAVTDFALALEQLERDADGSAAVQAPAVAASPGELSVIFQSDAVSAAPYALVYALTRAFPTIVGQRVFAEIRVLVGPDDPMTGPDLDLAS